MLWVCSIAILLFIAVVFLTEDALGQYDNHDISCYHCHSKQLIEFQKSVHRNISCADCHGGDINVSGIAISINVMNQNFAGVPTRINITNLCSRCHEEATTQYKESIHYKQLAKGRTQAASCIDCHGTHDILSSKNPASMTYSENIPLLCSKCHENQTTMQAYGIKTDRFDTYKKSYHYKAYVAGGKVLATCADCHKNHDVRSKDDPQSVIHPANLPDTCGKSGCHPGAQNVFIYGGKVHEEQSVFLGPIDAKKLVTYFYILMILFELAFTFGLIFLSISSNFEVRRRH